MKVWITAMIIGILMGIILITYTILKRRELPVWGIIMFSATGVLIIIACALIIAGTSKISA